MTCHCCISLWVNFHSLSYHVDSRSCFQRALIYSQIKQHVATHSIDRGWITFRMRVALEQSIFSSRKRLLGTTEHTKWCKHVYFGCSNNNLSEMGIEWFILSCTKCPLKLAMRIACVSLYSSLSKHNMCLLGSVCISFRFKDQKHSHKGESYQAPIVTPDSIGSRAMTRPWQIMLI